MADLDFPSVRGISLPRMRETLGLFGKDSLQNSIFDTDSVRKETFGKESSRTKTKFGQDSRRIP